MGRLSVSVRSVLAVVAVALIGALARARARRGLRLTLDPVGEFATPVLVSSDPSDPDRLFVVEKDEGRIQIKGGRGRDRIHCGKGRDTVIAGRGDRIARDCERVRRRR